uniref:Uncharacterized protein n=1 Tax=Ciona intestinalis TaxID=7719 RepID=H2XMG2_CIOIN
MGECNWLVVSRIIDAMHSYWCVRVSMETRGKFKTEMDASVPIPGYYTCSTE